MRCIVYESKFFFLRGFISDAKLNMSILDKQTLNIDNTKSIKGEQNMTKPEKDNGDQFGLQRFAAGLSELGASAAERVLLKNQGSCPEIA